MWKCQLYFRIMGLKIKELEDYAWFPAILRKYQMEMIGQTVSYFGFYHTIANRIKADLTTYGVKSITDLCSGSGQPGIYVHRKLQMPEVETLLTDKYPQQIKSHIGVVYSPNSLDINDLNPDAATFYTMYNAFHHLNDNEQKTLIQKVLTTKSQLMIVEIVQPGLLNIFMVTLASTLGVWFLCPMIRPLEWKRLIFTYILPLNVLTVLIDGYISVFKSKSIKDYTLTLETLFPAQTGITISEHRAFPAKIITIKINGNHGE